MSLPSHSGLYHSLFPVLHLLHDDGLVDEYINLIYEPLKSIVSLLLLSVMRCLYIFTAHTECVSST